MSDPIDQLASLSDQGAAMPALPPAEVRRRGDKLRRRNRIIAGTAAAAVIAIVATPIAVLAGGTDRAVEPPPATQTPEPTIDPSPSGSPSVSTVIPASFPISANLNGAQVTDTAELATQLAFCGEQPLSGLDPLDARSAVLSGGESNEVRTVVLLANDAEAEAAQSRLLNAVSACPSEPVGGASAQMDHRVLPVTEDWSGRTIESTYPNELGTTGGTMVHVVRSGPALLLTSSFLYAMPPDPTTSTRESIQPQVDAMAQFSATGVAAPAADPTASPTTQGTPAASGGPESSPASSPTATPVPTEVPADFDLTYDTPETDGDGETQGPGARTQGSYDVVPCETSVWPVTGSDRLAMISMLPEWYETRELVVFDSASQAQAQLEAIREAVRACPSEPVESDPVENSRAEWTVDRGDTGFATTFTFHRGFSDGLPGADIWQFTRVGSAILVVTTGGEYSGDTISENTLPRMNELTRAIAPQMCVFTAEGC